MAGAAAFALVFVGTLAVAGASAGQKLRLFLETRFPMTALSEQVTRLAFVGDAHFVPVGLGATTIHPLFWTHTKHAAAVPVLVLLAAGALLADADDWAASAWRGAAVVLGYVPAAVAAHFAFRATTRAGSRTVAPNLVHYVTATTGHALAFGALGGLLGYAVTTNADTSLRRAVDGVPVGAGAVAGAAAFAASYAATYVLGAKVLTVEGTSRSIAGALAESLPWVDGTANAVAYFLYNAQHVPLSPITTATRPANFVHSEFVTATVSNVDVLHVAPVLALTAAGYLVARHTGRGVVAGASVAVGYGALALVGLVVFASSAPRGPTVRPEPVVAALRMGIVMPLLFGGLGGFLADR